MSTPQTPLLNLVKREITRKDFLGTPGMTTLIVLNIEPATKIELLTRTSSHQVVSEGYDSSTYSDIKLKGSA